VQGGCCRRRDDDCPMPRAPSRNCIPGAERINRSPLPIRLIGYEPLRILFVHQNMPAQYAHLAVHYGSNPANEVVFMTRRAGRAIPGVRNIRYDLSRQTRTDGHHYIKFLDCSPSAPLRQFPSFG